MKKSRREFIADLWFVMALVMPILGAIALALARCELDPNHWAAILIPMLFGGPLYLSYDHLASAPLFLTACALPSLWILLEALALRLATDTDRLWPPLFVWVLRHLALTFCMGGVASYLCSPTGLILTAAPTLLYVASVVGSARFAKHRSMVFEITLGGILAERFVLPWIAMGWS